MKENQNEANIQRGSSQGYSKKVVSTGDEPLESFRVRETKRTMDTYGAEMLEELKSKQEKYWPKDCLKEHQISSSVRAKMVSILSIV